MRASLAVMVILAVAGCESGPSPFGATEGSSGNIVPPEMSRAAPGADVEAPDVFQLSGEGLWDGRPSLGGVWVAHASVNDPERVMIRNPKNGKSVVGALFRRERETPGPSLQVSSDAAEALGMLAGQPADLNVVALRRQEPPASAAAPAAPEPAPEVAESATPADAAPEAADAAAADVSDVAAAPLPAPAAETPKPARRGLFGLFRKKPKPEPAPTDPVAAGVASGPIEETPLGDVTAGAAAAIDRAEGAETAAAAPVAPAPSTLQRAYVQIGIFSTEANARRAGDQMKAAGMTATLIPDESQGKTYWRVIVGPAASVAERDALAARVKGIGYPDAYPVTK